MTRDEIYNFLCNKPTISCNLVFNFQSRQDDSYTNLVDLLIQDNKGNRLLLTDYIVQENLQIRIDTKKEGSKRQLKVKDGIDQLADYIILSLDDFLRLSSECKFSVEEY